MDFQKTFSSETMKPFRFFPVFLIIVIVFLVYSNSFQAEWHMDDRPNIVNNRDLHIQNLMPESIWQTFFANQGREEPKLFRPLACFTFAVNWYIGQDDTFGYHVVNLGFHIATAIALYILLIRLLSLVYMPGEHKKTHVYSIALFAAVLWAVHPIQTQAVTYIVQRMAVMAAFFYVLSVLYYVKARTADSIKQKWIFALLCVLWFLCAMGSKENAIMVPFSLVLVEWIFFQKGRTDFLRWPATWCTFAGLAIVAIISVLVLTGGAPLDTMRGWYGSRPFSFEERLLSQPRVVLTYLSQIFYPLPERFSIAHDVTLSKSVFFPWTTLPAIATIFAMISGALFLVKRHPLLSFAILFFFLNHVIESSILPLEIVFEHRNYLPTMFLFLPIAAGLISLLLKLKQDNRLVHGIMSVAIVFMLISVGISTYSRNEAWATGITLWSDAAQKAPSSVRPIVTLGIKLAWQDSPSQSDYKYALSLFRRALNLPEAARKTEKVEILNNIASTYFHMGEYDKAIATYLEALEIDPSFLKNRSGVLGPLILSGNFEDALYHAEHLIDRRPQNPDYLSRMGFIHLWMGNADEALPFFQKALAYGPNRPSLLLNIGVTLTRLESFENGRWLLHQSAKRSQGELVPLLALIENRVRAGDHETAAAYARYVVSRFPAPVIYNTLDNADKNYQSAPITPKHIAQFIEIELKISTFNIH